MTHDDMESESKLKGPFWVEISSNVRSYQFEVSVLVLELADLGFVTETLIFKTWNILDLIG